MWAIEWMCHIKWSHLYTNATGDKTRRTTSKISYFLSDEKWRRWHQCYMIVAFLIYSVFVVVFFNFTLEISFFCSELFVRAWSSLNRATRVFNCSYYVNGKQNYRLLKINNFFFFQRKHFHRPAKHTQRWNGS